MIEPQTSDNLTPKEYIGMVCHELKTPLSLLNLIIQLLDRKVGNGEDQSINKSIAKANEQICKMGNVINSFLNVSAIETGDICLHYECFKINHLIGEVVEQLRDFSKSHRIIMVCDETVLINADREKVGCVISNILLNAMKYSPEAKFIYIKCCRANDSVLIRVRDEGVGIETRYLDQIFEKRFRITEGNADKISGSGIGLYLSAMIVQKHGGKIWAESTVKQGSTFYFSLPLM